MVRSVLFWRARAILRRLMWRITDRFYPPKPAHRIEALCQKIKDRQGPVRVGFVVCDPAKWSAGPLFDSLAADPGFSVALHCTLSDTGLRLPAEARAAQFAKTKTFFEQIGPTGADLYDPVRDHLTELSAEETDLVFIQQPWGMQDLPRRLLRKGILSAYIHYGYAIISNDRMQFGLPDFHRFLWLYVAPSDIHRQEILAGAAPPYDVLVAGHPKLDVYATPAPARSSVSEWARPQDADRKRVIFAPHHTLDNSLKMGTFAWSGPAMLDLVRKYPDVDFLLKPHPNLALAMERGGPQSAQQFAEWLAAWAAEANTSQFTSGHYFDLFRSSDLMITDSGSFLAEYLPTGRPILRLTRPDAAPMNTAGQALLPAFYTADDGEQLGAAVHDLLIAQNDPLAGLRMEKAKLVHNVQSSSADTVAMHLRQLR